MSLGKDFAIRMAIETNHPPHSQAALLRRSWGHAWTIGSMVMVVCALVMGAIGHKTVGQLELSHQRQVKSEKLIGEVLTLDEILSMASTMYVLTSDDYWKNRYDQFNPAMSQAIKDFLQIFPDLKSGEQIDVSNQKMVDLEIQSFSIAKNGLKEKAFAVYFSEEYTKLKKIFSVSVDDARKNLEGRFYFEQAHLNSKLKTATLFRIIFIALALVGWSIVFLRLRSINRDLVDLSSTLESRIRENAMLLVRQAKLASLGEMSARIAHEINNPLAIISGSVGLLSKFADNPEKFSAKIESIQNSCIRISKIVQGLKKFSRSGDQVTLGSHSLCETVKEAIALTESKAKRYNTTVAYECKSDAPILCNEIEIEQVIVNLINNGIDAVERLQEKWVKITVFEEDSSVVLRVVDSGLGIPAEIRDRIFDPFFTTKPVGNGTGLGLSITKGILDEHGASISIVPDSPNTCFEIRFSKIERMKNVA